MMPPAQYVDYWQFSKVFSENSFKIILPGGFNNMQTRKSKDCVYVKCKGSVIKSTSNYLRCKHISRQWHLYYSSHC